MATPKLRLVTTSRKFDNTNYRALSMGVNLPAGRYVAPGSRIITQSAANSLPSVHQKKHYKARTRLFTSKRLGAVITKPKAAGCQVA